MGSAYSGNHDSLGCLDSVAGCLGGFPVTLSSGVAGRLLSSDTPFFLLGKEGSELDNYRQQRAHYESLPKTDRLARVFFYNYANYCKGQEKRTPLFQQFFAKWNALAQPDETVRQQFLAGSRPLMKYCNMLSFNLRAICLYATALNDCPWLYFVFEITVFNLMYVYMHRSHEQLSKRLADQLA